MHLIIFNSYPKGLFDYFGKSLKNSIEKK